MGKASFDIESLRLDPSLVGEVKPIAKRRRLKGRFLKGPIPTDWLIKALRVGKGSGLGIGNVLWHLSGLKNGERTVLLTTTECERWGITRQSKGRALGALENAGLVTVERHGKRNPLVTILDGEAELTIPFGN
jgi:DNA-binding transcriptional ArsR family regulator